MKYFLLRQLVYVKKKPYVVHIIIYTLIVLQQALSD